MPPSSLYPAGTQPSPSLSATSSGPSKAGVNRTRRTSATKAGAGGDSTRKGVSEDVDIENYRPPGWRTVLNRRADLGYPDFYPSRPGYNQPEDVLTEDNIKNGFTAKSFVAVGAESFSMHGPIHNHLRGGCLDMLIKLGQEVAEKRDEAMPAIGERAFRIPVRVTYNDTKRHQFLTELANPAVSLHRLMRNPVPHGFKGLELFDAMFSPTPGAGHIRTSSMSGPVPTEPIPIDRAIWFIRVLGANEITAHRGRAQPTAAPVSAPSPVAPTPSSTNTVSANPVLPLSSNDWYTQEFTVMFTSWLRIQLGQLSLPIGRGLPKVGLPPPKPVQGVLGDEKNRFRWLAKWDYSKTLLRDLHTRHLISSRLICSWLLNMLVSANLAQLGFVVQLVGEYLPDIANRVSIGRPCIRAACDKIKEILASTAADAMKKVEEMLVTVVSTLFEVAPEVMLSPITWRLHGDLIEYIVASSADRPTVKADPVRTSHSTPSDWRDVLQNLKRRSKALHFQPTSAEDTSSPRRHQMAEIHKLDAMDADTNMSDLCKSIFDANSSPSASSIDKDRLEGKVFILLNWAMGLFALGNHRFYAVYTLLKLWSEQYDEHRPKPFDFFPILYKWLDTSPAARKDDNTLAIGITYGELTRQGIFSYGRYLQTLIAYGHTARSRSSDHRPSHHLAILRALPIFAKAKDLLHQRRIALCGADVELRLQDEMEEEQAMEAFKEDVREYVPEIFGWKRYGRSAAIRDAIDYQLKSTIGMTRHSWVYIRFWLYPAAATCLRRQGRRPAMDASTFARVLHVFRTARGYATIADFVLQALRTSDSEEILLMIIDTLRREADIWTAIDRWPMFVDALLERLTAIDAQGQYCAELATLLLERAGKGHLSEEEEEDIRALVAKHSITINQSSVAWVDPQESMVVIRKAVSEADLRTLASMSAKLFSRHGPFSSWSAQWWATVVLGIQSAKMDTSTQPAIPSATLTHVVDVLDQSTDTLDPVVSSWLDSMPASALQDLLAQENSALICTFLLSLAAQRRLQTVPVLHKLVYPAWKHAATTAIVASGRLSGSHLRSVDATVVVAQQLLLTTPPNHQLPPVDLRQALIIQTARTKVFDSNNIRDLIRHLPYLVILQTVQGVSDKMRRQIAHLLQTLAMASNFKAAVFRHLELLKSVFLSNEWSQPSFDHSIEAGMVDALKLIMSDGSSAASNSITSIASLGSSPFSARRWTSIVLEMRVEFKRLTMRIQSGEGVAAARQTLSQLVHATLDREASADDTDLLCEAFRGLDPMVAHEVLAVGLQRLTSLLAAVIGSEHQDQLELADKSVDLILRILDSTPYHNITPVNTAVLQARHALLDLLVVALQAVERQISPEEDLQLPDGIQPPQPGDVFQVVLKLLEYTLGLPVMEVTSPAAMPKPDFSRLALSYLRVLMTCSEVTLAAAPETIGDMLGYIIDSAPAQSRFLICSALLAEAAAGPQDLAPSLVNLLPYRSPLRRAMALTAGGGIDDSHTELSSALDDRPWELFDHMFPPPPAAPHNEQFLSARPSRDTASIPTALFNPKIKRETMPNVQLHATDIDEGEIDDERTWEDYASERNLGSGFTGEPIAAKQLATMLFAGPEEATIENDITLITSRSPLPALEAAAMSPAATSVSGISQLARPRRKSTRLSQASGSNRDPIPIDEDEEGEISDDVEAIDGPATKRPRTASKSRPTTGGKAPARKTLGGKGVARKVTGGKSVKKTTGGKAPRTGRRRSIVE